MEGQIVKKIHTVNGEIEEKDIKKTMIHEHIVFDLSIIRGDNSSILGDVSTLSAIKAELKQLKENGFNTIVEQTNIGMGRNPELLKKISEEIGIYIISGTGYYKEGFYPIEVLKISEDQLADKLTKEIIEGMCDGKIKAGYYGEIGSSLNDFTSSERKIFRSVCKSHKETRAPICTHCELGTMGTEQMRLFDSEGISPEKVSFGHQDLNTDLKSQIDLLKWGAYIQYDTTGKVNYRSDEDRIKSILYLLEMGYEDKIMLSCDITRRTYLKAFGGHGYVSIYENFIPMLMNRGVTSEIINKLLVENPRRFLAY